MQKSKKQDLRIWFDKNRELEWKARNLSPSEMCLMAAAIQEAALKMMGDCEIGIDRDGTVKGVPR